MIRSPPRSTRLYTLFPATPRFRAVALLRSADLLGGRRQRERVGAEIGLAVAIAHDQRRAEPRADQHVGIIAAENGEAEGALEPLQRSDEHTSDIQSLMRFT